MLRTTLFPIVLIGLSACGSSSNKYAPAPVPVLENGVPTVDLIQGGGYTYTPTINAVGLAETDAVLIDGLPVRSAPLQGDATFEGRFDMDIITDIAGAGDTLSGNTESISGPLTLDVNFADRTVKSRDSDLVVDGTYTGTILTGTVSYDGLDGAMAGGIGARQAIGVFTREEADSIYAGGFYTNDAP